MPDAPPDPTTPPAAADVDGLLRRQRELEALRQAVVAACCTVVPEEIFGVLCTHARPLFAADFLSVSLRAFDGRRQWCGDEEPEAAVAARVPSLLARVREGGQPLAVAAPGAAAALGLDDGQVLRPSPGLGSALAAPLRDGADVFGALLVGWERAGAATPHLLRLAGELAECAAAAFRNAARYDEMRQAAVRRDRFFSAMSHDLRTPITAIVGYSELLQDGIFGDLPDKQQEMVERIYTISGHLSTLLNDVMDLAKLDAGRMEFHLESVVLGELVDEAVVAVEPQAAAKGLELRLEIDGWRDAVLRVDPPRVRQILVNLLSNAVKFTERGQVSLSAGIEDGRSWIEVRDTGPGLPAGSEEAVFEEFLQLSAGTRNKREPGSGLGLAISRRLARAMGGDLVARNVPASGAAFTLVLPYRAGP